MANFRKEKGKFSKGVLIAILVFLLLFTVTVLFIAYKTSYEPSTLISCVFAFCGLEGGLLAWVKTTKEKTKGGE